MSLAPIPNDSILQVPFAFGLANVPLHIAKSGMFSSVNDSAVKESGFFKDVVCFEDEKIKVSFSGHVLNQSDADLLMVVNELLKASQLDTGTIKLHRSTLLKELGWVVASSSYKRLLESMKRLTESVYYIESIDADDTEEKKSFPLKMFSYKQDGDMLEVWIPKESYPLYKDNSLLNWNKRKNIKSKSSLPKLIQFYMSSRKGQKDFLMELSELKTLARSVSPPNQFANSTKAALAELERVGIVEAGWKVILELGIYYCKWSAVTEVENNKKEVIQEEKNEQLTLL